MLYIYKADAVMIRYSLSSFDKYEAKLADKDQYSFFYSTSTEIGQLHFPQTILINGNSFFKFLKDCNLLMCNL